MGVTTLPSVLLLLHAHTLLADSKAQTFLLSSEGSHFGPDHPRKTENGVLSALHPQSRPQCRVSLKVSPLRVHGLSRAEGGPKLWHGRQHSREGRAVSQELPGQLCLPSLPSINRLLNPELFPVHFKCTFGSKDVS